MVFARDENFEAGVTPKVGREARLAGRRNANPGSIAVEAEAHLDFGCCRAAHARLNRANGRRAFRRMTLEVYPEVCPAVNSHRKRRTPEGFT